MSQTNEAKPGRRQALKGALALGSVSSGFLSAPSVGSVGGAEEQVADKDWAAVKQHFSVARKPPLNAANLAPAYQQVLNVQSRFTQRLNSDVSFVNRRDFVQKEVATARAACASLLGVTSEEVAFVRNTSEGNATIVSGLGLKPESEVVLWDQNHSTNYRSWHYQHQRRPFVVRQVALPQQPNSPQALIQPFLDALSANTAAVSFSHVSNVSGMRLPLADLCRAIKQYREDIYIHVDGAQSFGCIDVDLSLLDCDSYTAPTHKWLCGPRGVGVLVVKRQSVGRLLPLQVGYDLEYNYPIEGLSEQALRFECVGQRDTAALAAVAEAVRQHQQIGMKAIEQRVSHLTEYTKSAFSKAGIATHTPKNKALSHGVVVADVGGKIKAIAAFLALHNAGYAAAFVHGQEAHCDINRTHANTTSPTWLRICPHIYNDEAEIDEAVEVVKRTTESTLEMLKQAWQFL